MMKITITSADNNKVYENIKSVSLPAFSGQMDILSGHAEAFIMLIAGQIVIYPVTGEPETISITDGEGYFKDNLMVIIL